MCIKFREMRVKDSLSLATLCSLIVIGLPLQRAEAQCNGGGLASTISVSPTTAHVGDVITITQLGVSLGAGVCTVSNGQSFLMYPNGNTNIVAGPPTGDGLNGIQQYETNFSILVAPGAVQCLPTADAAAGCSPITTTYTVLAADVGIQLGPWTTPRGFATIFQPAKPKTVHFMAASDAFKTSDGLGEGGTAPAEVIIITPCIAITKLCDYPQGQNCFAIGGPVVFTGVVTNCGDTTLFGVTVSDSLGGAITNFGATTSSGRAYDGTLTNGESISYSGSYTPTTSCGSETNTVTVVGTDVTGLSLTNTATAVCDICCPPDICVTKGVVCAPSDGSDCGPGLAYAPSATGAAGPTNQASFCYEIVVWNCGSDVLTNVTVVDNKITIVAGSFPTTLAVNERATNYFQASYGPNTSTTNVVTATGTGQSSGIVTNAVAQAIANVLPVGVVCDVTLSSAGAVEGGQCEVTLDANNGSNQPVTFTLVITNTGLVDLNVALSGVPALVDCGDPTNAVTVPLSVLIPAGGVYTLTGCVLVSCPGAQFDVRVQGSAEAGTNLVCVVDADGNVVTTGEPSQCTAQVCCVTPVTCRTTGGGQLIPGFSNPNCIEVPTTIFPATAGGSNVVFKITHGGQLGAPYAHQDCGEILGNPCIRGQWEHNRHYEGKGNPKDTITAFHTVTPKGQFDSLSCACLPCCPSEGVTNAATTGPGKKFVLCNPDDHKICGPMPRPAPANALIWSGIGVLKHVDDNGSKGGEWVVLRVYIEDRSEPGGGHPGGSVDPADVYSFQAWKTGVLVTKKPDFTKIAPEFRFALAQDSCRFLEALQTGALPQGSLPTDSVNGLSADVIDKGPLYDGNRQIHPSTSATCTP